MKKLVIIGLAVTAAAAALVGFNALMNHLYEDELAYMFDDEE